MKKREKRVIDAFVNCIRHGEFTVDYADVLIADQSKYGWLSEAALDYYEEQTEQFRPVEEEPVEEAESGGEVTNNGQHNLIHS